MSAPPKYDILVWGASGFTGKLAAEYLARHYPPSPSLTWAIGGRTESRLQPVKASLEAIDGACREVGVVVGDPAGGGSGEADRVAAFARVVVSYAGPFAQCGTELVEACVRTGAHYCDITGEVGWANGLAERLNGAARERGVCIVPFCGFDSIPSDIGTFMMVDYVRKNLNGRAVERVDFFHGQGKLPRGMAGGTFRTLLLSVEDRTSRRALRDPHSYTPADGPRPACEPDVVPPRYSRALGQWYTVFPMSMVNTRVVRRTNALAGYGEGFVYQEYLSAGLLRCLVMFCVSFVALLLLRLGPVRRFIAGRLPPPGEGPSREALAGAYFTGRYVARTGAGPAGEPALTVFGRVRSEGDAGYNETAKMSCEAAVCLATQMDEIRGRGVEGGVLTPAASMGELLLERLRRARMVFEVERVVNPGA